MKILTKTQFATLLEDNPTKHFAFVEYDYDIIKSEIHITDGDGDFGATELIPKHGELFDYDWNLAEYSDNALFLVFDNNDIAQMIQLLSTAFDNIELSADY